jgi:hypothetical protein
MILHANDLQVQVYEVVKGADPTTLIHIRGDDERNSTNGETARVVSGRVGRVRKRLLPEFDMGVRAVEFDVSKEVFSRPRNP